MFLQEWLAMVESVISAGLWGSVEGCASLACRRFIFLPDFCYSYTDFFR